MGGERFPKNEQGRIKPFEGTAELSQEEAEATAAFGVPLDQEEQSGIDEVLNRVSEVGNGLPNNTVTVESSKNTPPNQLGIIDFQKGIEMGLTGKVIDALTDMSNKAQ